MDIDAKLSLLEWIEEDLGAWSHAGYGGAGLVWAEIPGLSHLGAWAMIGSFVLSLLVKYVARYRKRLIARITVANPEGLRSLAP